MNLIVNIKQVYGNEAIYPACDTSRLFTTLTGRKTLTRHDLGIIRALGYNIQVNHGAAIALACQLNGSPA